MPSTATVPVGCRPQPRCNRRPCCFRAAAALRSRAGCSGDRGQARVAASACGLDASRVAMSSPMFSASRMPTTRCWNVTSAVVDGVAEAVRPVVVGIRHVEDSAIELDCRAAVGRIGDRSNGDRVGLRVAVVGQHRDGCRGVLRRGGGVVSRDRRVAGQQRQDGAIGVQNAATEVLRIPRVARRDRSRVDPEAHVGGGTELRSDVVEQARQARVGDPCREHERNRAGEMRRR